MGLLAVSSSNVLPIKQVAVIYSLARVWENSPEQLQFTFSVWGFSNYSR